ncbi:MAG: type IV secretion system DNA-binding domain-containing protein [Candidatus Rokubacteria bacterium]|nr:type IV secretion system DNA-binding domain-containing protein [Candidatus Rokubacteria bacterium]
MDISPRWTWCTLILIGSFLAALSFPLRSLGLLGLGPATYLTLRLGCRLLGLALCGGGLLMLLTTRKQAPRPTPAPRVPDSLTLGWDPTGGWIRLGNEAQQRHTLVIGSSGSGKTQLLLSLLAQQIARGGGVLMIDAKVDRSALQTILDLCRQVNRLGDLRMVWPPDPSISHTWNPLLRGNLQEVLSRVMALWGTSARGEAEFWRGSAHTVLHAVLGAMKRINPQVTFNDLYLAVTTADALLWLEQQVPPGTEEASALTAFLSNYRTQQGRLNLDHLKRMTGGVPQYVSAYAWGHLGQIMNHAAPTLDILEALVEGQIVYVALPILARTEEATAMARMLIADLKQAVGVLQQRVEKPTIPFLVIMDEASAYTNVEGIERLFEQARGAGVALVAASQVLSGFATSTKAQLDFIVGNTATKVLMSLGDFPSAETMAKTIGEERAFFATASTVAQRGTSAPWISPLPTKASRGTSEAHGAAERYDYTIRPEQLMRQRTGQAVVFIRDPTSGSFLYPQTRTCYLPVGATTPVALLPAERTDGTGLNLLRRIQEGTLAAAGPAPAPRQNAGGARRSSGGVRRRESKDFTVIEPRQPPSGS